jgi:hypothetical protein
MRSTNLRNLISAQISTRKMDGKVESWFVVWAAGLVSGHS